MSGTMTLPNPAVPGFRGLFPDWRGRRPLDFFFLEELLEARAASRFPTNSAGADEDVNVFLAHLLTRLAVAGRPGEAVFGSGPMIQPPEPGASVRRQAAWYRRQGEHRLLYLGLFDRGEARRRRATLYGMSPGETRLRDTACARACLEVAANLHARIPGAGGQAQVLAKIAADLESYIHVLGVLATRRWGLGARISDRALRDLLEGSSEAPGRDPGVPGPRPGPTSADYDAFLDLWSRYRESGEPMDRAALAAKAAELGIGTSSLE
ncbi:MAG: hypothetical protein AB7V45_11090 [Candidatus Krumholzibacteriia bacterium]